MKNTIENPVVIEKKAGCVANALKIVGNKWTALILRDLANGTRRFSELERSLKGISPRTLSQRLDDLLCADIVEKKVFAEVPPHVEYTLTRKGRDLVPLLQQMADWGVKYGS